MFAGGYSGIFHFHLKKCAGTSLNSWLDWHAPDDRLWTEPGPDDAFLKVPSARQIEVIFKTCFFTGPILHSHHLATQFAPPGTFLVTVLREPTKRLLSQVADWRREASRGAQHTGAPSLYIQAIADSIRMPLVTYLQKYGELLPDLFDNHETRMLAASGTGNPADGLAAAKEALSRFDVVGLTERLDETKAAICSRLGLVPDAVAGRRNVTSLSNISEEEISEAREIIGRLTALDRQFYQHAERSFEARHLQEASFTESDFERKHAASAVLRISPRRYDGTAFVSVRDTLLASGIWGRDSAGRENCNVWTGPNTRTVLYMPCPPGENLNVHLWIRGYAADRQRSQLRFEIDDVPVAHEFEDYPGWRERATLRARSRAPFIKLTMHLDETLTSQEAGLGSGDERKRGVAFGGYGWSIDTLS